MLSDLPAARTFEVWIDGAEEVRGLVRATSMLAARRDFLARLRAVSHCFGIRRIRARELGEDEARELYPEAVSQNSGPSRDCPMLRRSARVSASPVK